METMEQKINEISIFILLLITLSFISMPTSAAQLPCPNPDDAPLFARWLVSRSTWGVLNTLDMATLSPFGNVQSYTDAGGTGTSYFYLSTILDPTGQNAVVDPRASFTVSEYALGSCKDDPKYPDCAKITLSGKLELLLKNSSEANFGEAALFAAHPKFRGFPKMMGFDVFKLNIEDIFLVNKRELAARPSVSDYYKIKLYN